MYIKEWSILQLQFSGNTPNRLGRVKVQVAVLDWKQQAERRSKRGKNESPVFLEQLS